MKTRKGRYYRLTNDVIAELDKLAQAARFWALLP